MTSGNGGALPPLRTATPGGPPAPRRTGSVVVRPVRRGDSMSFLVAFLVGMGCFGLCVLATLGTDHITPTQPADEKGGPA